MKKSAFLLTAVLSTTLMGCNNSEASPSREESKQLTINDIKNGPADKLICLEFASDAGFEAFATAMKIPNGTKISYKQGDSCKGILVEKKDIKF